jgi:hypothetical protein
MFEITKEVRDLDLPALQACLIARMNGEKDKIDAIVIASYDTLKRQDLLHLLARIATYLEDSIDFSTKVGFQNYVDRSRDSRTFDIEHLLANDLTKVNSDISKGAKVPFPTLTEFSKKRSLLGGLILLPRGRNRSMKDMAYTDKLSRYTGENVLAQTLTDAFFLNQPNWTKFASGSTIACAAIPIMDSTMIDQRGKFYLDVAKNIWNEENLNAILT